LKQSKETGRTRARRKRVDKYIHLINREATERLDKVADNIKRLKMSVYPDAEFLEAGFIEYAGSHLISAADNIDKIYSDINKHDIGMYSIYMGLRAFRKKISPFKNAYLCKYFDAIHDVLTWNHDSLIFEIYRNRFIKYRRVHSVVLKRVKTFSEYLYDVLLLALGHEIQKLINIEPISIGGYYTFELINKKPEHIPIMITRMAGIMGITREAIYDLLRRKSDLCSYLVNIGYINYTQER